MLDPKRSARQWEIVQAWGQTGGRGTLEAAVGFGKTRVGLEACKALRDKYPTTQSYDVDTLVVVPSIPLRDKWGEDVRKENLRGVQIWVINSLVLRQIPIKCRLLILDEVHSYTGEVFREVFELVQWDHALGLSGSLPEDQERKRVITQYLPIFATVPLEECLKNKWISPYTIWNVPVHLSPEEKEQYNRINGAFHKHFGVFNDLDLIYRIVKDKSKREAANYGSLINWDAHKVWLEAVNANRFVRKRVEFLTELRGKDEITRQICERAKESKVITFSATTAQCDHLTEIIPGSLSYHSKVKGEKIHGNYFGKEKILNRNLIFFREGKIHVLNSAKALEQGVDIPLVDLLIILSGSSKLRQAIQRLGRALRYVEGKHTKQIELYVAGTQEERWLRDRQSQLPGEHIIYVNSIDEIPL